MTIHNIQELHVHSNVAYSAVHSAVLFIKHACMQAQLPNSEESASQ